jgi:hypothetical protein
MSARSGPVFELAAEHKHVARCLRLRFKFGPQRIHHAGRHCHLNRGRHVHRHCEVRTQA